jgi:hypothetical protein
MCSLFTEIGNLCLLRFILQSFSNNFGNTICKPTQKGEVNSVVLPYKLKTKGLNK